MICLGNLDFGLRGGMVLLFEARGIVALLRGTWRWGFGIVEWTLAEGSGSSGSNLGDAASDPSEMMGTTKWEAETSWIGDDLG